MTLVRNHWNEREEKGINILVYRPKKPINDAAVKTANGGERR